jgi:hypothetical protein
MLDNMSLRRWRRMVPMLLSCLRCWRKKRAEQRYRHNEAHI